MDQMCSVDFQNLVQQFIWGLGIHIPENVPTRRQGPDLSHRLVQRGRGDVLLLCCLLRVKTVPDSGLSELQAAAGSFWRPSRITANLSPISINSNWIPTISARVSCRALPSLSGSTREPQGEARSIVHAADRTSYSYSIWLSDVLLDKWRTQTIRQPVTSSIAAHRNNPGPGIYSTAALRNEDEKSSLSPHISSAVQTLKERKKKKKRKRSFFRFFWNTTKSMSYVDFHYTMCVHHCICICICMYVRSLKDSSGLR